MEIVDAHHHIWQQADLPWLNGPMQPRIFGEYTAIMRDYPMREFIEDCADTGVKRSVYVQANWAPERHVDEVAWVQAIAEEYGLIHGIIGYADFTVEDVRTQLDKLLPFPLMRGVRQQLHWHPNPAYRFATHADLAMDSVVQKNIARLADYGWSFDLQVFDEQMPGARQLAESAPGVRFILQHAGMLEDASETGRERWLGHLRDLAEAPNVYAKLSAFGTFIHRNDAQHIQSMIEDTVGVFGADRCLFGSNFPIEKIWTDYRSLLNAFMQGSAALGESKQRQLFHDTAAFVYRL